MMNLKVRIDGRDVTGQAEFVRGVLWLHAEGRTIAVDAGKPGARRAGKRGDGGGGDIAAPMPGKVTKIFAKPGAAVSRGDAVVVMEAMKMEYTLKAEADGIVAEVACKTDDQVSLGQTLVRLTVKDVK